MSIPLPAPRSAAFILCWLQILSACMGRVDTASQADKKCAPPCNESTVTVKRLAPENITLDSTGILYVLDTDNKVARQREIRRWSTLTQLELTPIKLDGRDVGGDNLDVVRESPYFMAYSAPNSRLYLGYPSGAITYIDLGVDVRVEELTEHPLITLSTPLTGLTVVGEYLLVQDQNDNGSVSTYSHAGQFITRFSNLQQTGVMQWDEKNGRIYALRVGQNPLLMYQTIDQTNGSIGQARESAYDDQRLLRDPFRFSKDAALLLLGSGDIYSTAGLARLGGLTRPITDADWLPGGGLLLLSAINNETRLLRYNANLKTIADSVNFPGQPLRLLEYNGNYAVVSYQNDDFVISRYVPISDTDQDGVTNEADAFPMDAAAAQDTDGDGYPDVWNDAAVIGESPLRLDRYPLDYMCYLAEHGYETGTGTACDHGSTLSSFNPTALAMDARGVVYILDSANNWIYRWSSSAGRYLAPVSVGSTAVLAARAPISMAYVSTADKLYLGYPGGAIRFIQLNPDLESEWQEVDFAAVAGDVEALVPVGAYLLVQHSMLAQYSSGAQRHTILDSTGLARDSVESKRSSAYVWNAELGRVYFFSDNHLLPEPNTAMTKLHYETIAATTGLFSGMGQSNDNGDYEMLPPIRLSTDASRLLLGSGDIYTASDQLWLGSMGTRVTDALWLSDGGLISLSELAAATVLQRRGAALEIIREQLNYAGLPVGLFALESGYLVVTRADATQAERGFQFHVYTPTDDSDQDGVANLDDAFPTDVSAAMDSDGDGYPDAWNPGFSETSSTSHLTLDYFPQDSACQFARQGLAGVCNISATIPAFIPDAIVQGDATTIYLLSSAQRRIYVWSTARGAYLNPILLGASDTGADRGPIDIAFSPTAQRLFLGYATGLITTIDVATERFERPLQNLGAKSRKLEVIGDLLLVETDSRASGYSRHMILNRAGAIVDNLNWKPTSASFAWNANNQQLYFFNQRQAPDRLLFETIDPNNGRIGQTQQPVNIPYITNTLLRLSVEGDRLLVGSGSVYAAEDLRWLGSLGRPIVDALWLPNGDLISLANAPGGTLLERTSSNLHTLLERVNLPGTPLRLLVDGEDYTVITRSATAIAFVRYRINDDTDGDTVQNSVDAFPTDPAASVDRDADGYPDQWNPDAGASDSTTGLVLDAYPLDGACHLSAQGNSTVCNSVTTLPVFVPVRVVADAAANVYLLDAQQRRIQRWSPVVERFISPILLAISMAEPTQLIYSVQQQRLYVGYATGEIGYIELNPALPGVLREQHYVTLPRPVRELVAVADYVVAFTEGDYGQTRYLLDPTGSPLQVIETNYVVLATHWSVSGNHLFMVYRDQPGAANLRVETIDTGSGLVTQVRTGVGITGDVWQQGLWVAEDESILVLGNGEIHAAATLARIDEIGTGDGLGAAVANAVWQNEVLLLDRVAGSQTAAQTPLEIHTANGRQFLHPLSVPGRSLGLFANGLDLIRVYSDTTGLKVAHIPIADHDGDGLPAWWETHYGLADNNVADALTDTDADGLSALQEYGYGTAPTNNDTDADLVPDGDETLVQGTNPLLTDSDDDGLSDRAELYVYLTNPLLRDSDVDGLDDGREITLGTNPRVQDSDSDGLPDAVEVGNGLNPLLDDARLDPDQDGLDNLAEITQHSDPHLADTDDDGLTDGIEVNTHATSPILYDSDADGLPDGWELESGFDPLSSADGGLDADLDGFSNRVEFHLDTDIRDPLSRPAVNPWMTYQGNAAHTGFTPLLLAGGIPEILWQQGSFESRPFENCWLNPVILAADRVIISMDCSGLGKQVAALDAADGHLLWRNSYAAISSIDPPAYADGRVYFQTGGQTDSYLRVLDVTTGVEVVKLAYSNGWQSFQGLTPYAGQIYLPAGDPAGVYAFDAANVVGAGVLDRQWFTALGPYQQWAPAVDQAYVYSYLGSSDGFPGGLTLLHRQTGQIALTIADSGYVWGGYYMDVSPVLGRGQNVIVSNAGRVLRFDLKRETIAWQKTEAFSGQPSYALGRIYSLNNGELTVLDEVTGAVMWRWRSPDGGDLTGNIALSIDLAFVSNATKTYAIDLQTQQSVWSQPGSGHLSLSQSGELCIAGHTGEFQYIRFRGGVTQ